MEQHSIKQMKEQMKEMYNDIQATEKENDNPDKEKVQLHQKKQNPMHQRGPPKPINTTTQLLKHCKKVERHLEKYCFEIKENE